MSASFRPKRYTAFHVQVKFLQAIYKFLKFEWGNKFLSEPYLRITSRLELNDPYDYAPFTSDVEKASWESSVYSKNYVRDEQHIIDHHLNGIGVISFTESIDSILMWSHYAGDHSGVAIGFNPKHDFFSELKRVQYEHQRPNLRDELPNIMGTELFFKSEQWSYEKEWRLVKSFIKADKVYDNNLEQFCTKPGVPFPCIKPYIALLEVPLDAITSITLGCRTKQSEIEKVKNKIINSEKLSHIKIRKVVLNLDKYELIFKDI